MDIAELRTQIRLLLFEAATPKELDEIAHIIREVVQEEIDDVYERIG